MTITWRGPLLLVSLVAALVFAGCGGDDKDSSTSTAAATQEAATVADDSGGTATEEAAADDAGGGDFCEKLENVGKNLQDQTSLSDPQKLSQFFAQVSDVLESADPPAELQDKWNTLEDLFSTYAKVFKDADFSDPQSLTGLQDDLQKFQDKQDEIVSATTALSQYAADHCGGAF